MDRSHRNSLNKKKGNSFENVVVKILQKEFPEYKFARTPGSYQFKYTETKGDIITDEKFPIRQIECRNREFSSKYDIRRFFESFESSDFGKWFKECEKKFDQRWLLVFKIGRGDVYAVTKEEIKGVEHLFNGKCYLYRLIDYLRKMKKEIK